MPKGSGICFSFTGIISPDRQRPEAALIYYHKPPCNPTAGALSLFCDIYSNNCQLCDTGSWKVIEVFGSIPDLREDFLNCYDNAEPFVILTCPP